MLAQLLFHSVEEDLAVLDVIALEPAVEFGHSRPGAPISLALRIPRDLSDEAVEAMVAFDRWAARIAVVDVDIDWVDGDECLTVADQLGAAVVLQIVG
jgi:hypothetical protein